MYKGAKMPNFSCSLNVSFLLFNDRNSVQITCLTFLSDVFLVFWFFHFLEKDNVL